MTATAGADTEEIVAPSGPPTARPSTLRRVLAAGAPAAIFLGARGLGFLLWWAMATARRPIRLDVWDGRWYLLVARDGYVGTNLIAPGDHHTAFAAYAFFPGYPWAVRVLTAVVGGHPLVAAVGLTLLAGVAFAYGVARLTLRITASPAAALVAVLLTAAAPMSVVYGLAYAETLLFALTVWALVALVDRRWLAAGLLTCAAGVVRPSAAALIAVVVVVALHRAWRDRDARALGAAVVAPLGLLGYYAVVAHATGSLDGYARLQAAEWDTRFDGGVTTVSWMARTLMTGTAAYPVLCCAVIAAVVAALLLGFRRVPAPVWTYGLLSVVLALASSGVMFSRPRMLLAAFVLLIPLAAWTVRQRRAVVVTLLAGYVLVGTWMSVYALTVWTYAI